MNKKLTQQIREEDLEEQRESAAIIKEAKTSALIMDWFDKWCEKTNRGGGVLITTSIKELLTDFYNDNFPASYMDSLRDWTRVEDGLPEKEVRVLVFTGMNPTDDFMIGYISEVNGNWFDEEANYMSIPVTHWQPLPTPPVNQ